MEGQPQYKATNTLIYVRGEAYEPVTQIYTTQETCSA